MAREGWSDSDKRACIHRQWHFQAIGRIFRALMPWVRAVLQHASRASTRNHTPPQVHEAAGEERWQSMRRGSPLLSRHRRTPASFALFPILNRLVAGVDGRQSLINSAEVVSADAQKITLGEFPNKNVARRLLFMEAPRAARSRSPASHANLWAMRQPMQHTCRSCL